MYPSWVMVLSVMVSERPGSTRACCAVPPFGARASRTCGPAATSRGPRSGATPMEVPSM
ncbi:MAG: hypothetical protein U0326_40340 [Polyangiales bacterium]